MRPSQSEATVRTIRTLQHHRSGLWLADHNNKCRDECNRDDGDIERLGKSERRSDDGVVPVQSLGPRYMRRYVRNADSDGRWDRSRLGNVGRSVLIRRGGPDARRDRVLFRRCPERLRPFVRRCHVVYTDRSRLHSAWRNIASNAAGWTLDTEWQIGPAMASSPTQAGNGDPATDTSTTADNGIAGVVIGGNAAQSIHSYRYLTSPAVNTDVAGPVTLSFNRWLNSDHLPYMQNSVEVWNGTSWTTIWETGEAPGNSGQLLGSTKLRSDTL